MGQINIDTNILIAYLAGESEVVEFLDTWLQEGGVLYISTIVEHVKCYRV